MGMVRILKNVQVSLPISKVDYRGQAVITTDTVQIMCAVSLLDGWQALHQLSTNCWNNFIAAWWAELHSCATPLHRAAIYHSTRRKQIVESFRLQFCAVV